MRLCLSQCVFLSTHSVVSTCEQAGRTLAHCFASDKDGVNILRLLQRHGLSLHKKDQVLVPSCPVLVVLRFFCQSTTLSTLQNGASPFLMAKRCNVAQFLLKQGADVNEADEVLGKATMLHSTRELTMG